MAQRQIVIVGGGIIGCTTAYYLSKTPGVAVTLIEASKNGPAQGASGKAGGLIALWAYPKPLVGPSFKEHLRLAQEYNGKDRWGFRFVNCGSWEGKGKDPSEADQPRLKEKKSLEKKLGLDEGKSRPTGLPSDLDWVHSPFTESYAPMAGPEQTAQVHPYLFTTSMFELAKENGVQYIQGTVTDVQKSGNRVTGVLYKDADSAEKSLSATDVVICAGAWSPRILPSLPITGTRAHSITVHPQQDVTISPYVLFTEINFESKGLRTIATPEIYARPDNEVYACGPGDSPELPESVDDVLVDAEACESIWRHVASISPTLREGNVDKRQACVLPIAAKGSGPFIGKASTLENLYIATGHTCWGICNAPGTALAISELILTGEVKCTDLSSLSPSKFI